MFSLCHPGNGDLNIQGGPENNDMNDNRGKQTPVTTENKQLRAVTKGNKQLSAVTKGMPMLTIGQARH